MAAFDNFVVASPRYFEPMSRYEAGPEYSDTLSRVLPSDWELVRHDVWLSANPRGARVPDQGLKIHISAIAADAPEILAAVAQVCLRANTVFKCAADRRILGMLNGKRCTRGSAGKFMTIYPRDRDQFITLIDDLDQATKRFAGPYILSDRRYKDSKVVFYRYGGFAQRRRLMPNGLTRLVIVGPNGALIDDERTPFFNLPEGVTDPFPPAAEAVTPRAIPVLQDRFEITGALAFSNAGGVYAAIDRETGTKVVVKEARPYTHSWTNGTVSFDAVSLVQREYQTLDYLRDVGAFPRPVALFQEWEHWFLVQEFVGGEPLRTYRAKDELLVMANIDEPERVASFERAFRALGLQLIAILEQVHARDMILGDISPNNVLVDALGDGGLRVRMIDLESAFRRDEPPAFAAFSRVWRTAGFRDQARAARGDALDSADDWYAVGMLLHGTVIPVEGLADLSPLAVHRFLKRFIEAGLPPFVETTITSLLAGDVAAARQALTS